MSFFHQLPEDVNLLIFQLVPRVDWVCVSLVCQQWKRLIDSFPIHHLDKNEYFHLSPLELIGVVDMRSIQLEKFKRLNVVALFALISPIGRIRYQDIWSSWVMIALFDLKYHFLFKLISNSLVPDRCALGIEKYINSLTNDEKSHLFRQLEKKMLKVAGNRDARVIIQSYISGNNDFSCHHQLWLIGEKELAITMWNHKQITCHVEELMFLYANQKYGLELFDCCLSGTHWDLVFQYITKNPVKMIQAMATDIGNLITRSIAKRFCRLHPSVYPLWKRLKSMEITEYEYCDIPEYSCSYEYVIDSSDDETDETDDYLVEIVDNI